MKTLGSGTEVLFSQFIVFIAENSFVDKCSEFMFIYYSMF